MLAMQSKLSQLVFEFKSEVGYPGELNIGGPHEPYKDPMRRVQFPYANEPGCYLFVTDAASSGIETVVYVGKGSRDIGGRIWSHLGRRARRGESELFPDAESWVKKLRPRLWSIALMNKKHWYLAAALEGFLIEQLRPLENKNKR